MEKHQIEWLKGQKEMCEEKLKNRKNGVCELERELEVIEGLLAYVDGGAYGVSTRGPKADKPVTRFQVFQAFTDAEHFAYSIWPIVYTLKTREEFIELLNSEFTEEELQFMVAAAQDGHYPVSLERLQ